MQLNVVNFFLIAVKYVFKYSLHSPNKTQLSKVLMVNVVKKLPILKFILYNVMHNVIFRFGTSSGQNEKKKKSLINKIYVVISENKYACELRVSF